MGYRFGPEGLAIAYKTLNNFVERAIRLYEQEPEEPLGSTWIEEYVKRWVGWAMRGVDLGAIHRAPHMPRVWFPERIGGHAKNNKGPPEKALAREWVRFCLIHVHGLG